MEILRHGPHRKSFTKGANAAARANGRERQQAEFGVAIKSHIGDYKSTR
jgi:hypothetical protein